jgi:hypothetical protein
MKQLVWLPLIIISSFIFILTKDGTKTKQLIVQ